MALPRMRTAAGVLAIIKEEDPNTEVTLHYLRHLINAHKVAVTPVGTKKLVDADAVIAYIAAGTASAEPEKAAPFPGYGTLRRVPYGEIKE